MATPKNVRILITGGGTGGHVAPAIAIVQAIQERANRPDAGFTPIFQYVGSEQGIEAKLARDAGIPFVGVATGKLRRSSKGPLGLLTAANIRDAFRVPIGILQAIKEVKRFKPDVVLATGGYVSVPPVLAAGMLRIPVLTHEQTVTIGLANKIAGRYATKIALSFEDSMAELSPALRSKAFVTGNPIRSVIFGGNPQSAVTRYNFSPEDNALPCLYVTGGAQGSRIINRAVETILGDLLPHCRIIHQCGKQPEGMEQDFDRLTTTCAKLPAPLQRRFHVTRFVEASEIGNVYALSDLIIGRSGAGTVAEICALGKAALFVPLVPTSGDEQTKNARKLTNRGAAQMLSQSDCNGPNLLTAIQNLISDRAKLSTMGKAAQTMATPNAAEDLVNALLSLAGIK